MFQDSSEEDEDAEDIDAYEKDEFIVGDDDDLSGDDDDDADLDAELYADAAQQRKKGQRKRRKYREDSPELAESELQLLEDQGAHVTRKKQLKILRKGADDDDDIHDELRNLMDDYTDPDEVRDVNPRRTPDNDFDYDDDMDYFIDDGDAVVLRKERALVLQMAFELVAPFSVTPTTYFSINQALARSSPVLVEVF